MAEAEKPSKRATTRKEKKKTSTKQSIVLIVGSIAMIVCLQMTYVLFIIGMLPAIVAYYIDRTPSHRIFHTVMPCNLSGVLPFVLQLANTGNNTRDMQLILSDSESLLIMYSSAAFGWMLVYGAPMMASLVINMLNGRHIHRLRTSQHSLTQEWGEEVARPAQQ